MNSLNRTCCLLGPGCPSGHSTCCLIAADAAATLVTLNSSAPSTHSFFNMTSISTTDFVVWPHPTPAAWKDIQTVALRALVTLEWFGNSKVQARLDQQEKGPKSRVYQAYMYMQGLIVLVHQLVGHIMDPHLDMQQVVRSAVIQGTPHQRMMPCLWPDCYTPVSRPLVACCMHTSLCCCQSCDSVQLLCQAVADTPSVKGQKLMH